MGARRYEISLQVFNSITRHLTRSLRSQVSYGVEHLKRNFISTRAHVLFSIYPIEIANQLLTYHSALAQLGQIDE